MGVFLDDLTVAFGMTCDEANLTYEQGIERAERLAEEFMDAAEERRSYAVVEGDRE